MGVAFSINPHSGVFVNFIKVFTPHLPTLFTYDFNVILMAYLDIGELDLNVFLSNYQTIIYLLIIEAYLSLSVAEEVHILYFEEFLDIFS